MSTDADTAPIDDVRAGRGLRAGGWSISQWGLSKTFASGATVKLDADDVARTVRFDGRRGGHACPIEMAQAGLLTEGFCFAFAAAVAFLHHRWTGDAYRDCNPGSGLHDGLVEAWRRQNKSDRFRVEFWRQADRLYPDHEQRAFDDKEYARLEDITDAVLGTQSEAP